MDAAISSTNGITASALTALPKRTSLNILATAFFDVSIVRLAAFISCAALTFVTLLALAGASFFCSSTTSSIGLGANGPSESTSTPLLASITTSLMTLARRLCKSFASSSTNFVFQKGWSTHAPLSSWICIPSLTCVVFIVFNIRYASSQQ